MVIGEGVSGDSQAHVFDLNAGTVRTFNDPTPEEGVFGISVAIDGNHLLIGDTNGSKDVGQVHLYDATTGNLLHTFNDPTPHPGGVGQGDFFGQGGSIAIDGNLVLIGDQRDDTAGPNVGQAHLFDADTGNLIRTFNDPTPEVGEGFGALVDIDGNLALILDGADNDTGSDISQVFLFDATTGNLLETFEDPSPVLQSAFGTPAISGDLVLIGSPGNTDPPLVGEAHLYDVSGLLSV